MRMCCARGASAESRVVMACTRRLTEQVQCACVGADRPCNLLQAIDGNQLKVGQVCWLAVSIITSVSSRRHLQDVWVPDDLNIFKKVRVVEIATDSEKVTFEDEDGQV